MKANESQHSQSMFYGAPAEIFVKAAKLRQTMTEAEIVLWDELKNKKMLNYKFRRQHPIGLYIADFYCHQLKLVIEIDGEYHLSKDQTELDKSRTKILNDYGLNLIRFSNYEVLNTKPIVLEKIKKTIITIKSK